MIKPWIECPIETARQLEDLLERFGINLKNNRNDYTSPVQLYNNYGLISYTLRNNLDNLANTLYARSYNITDEDTRLLCRLEHYILGLLGTFNPTIFDIIRQIFTLQDRRGTERFDPIPVPTRTLTQYKATLSYLPKGITDFNESTDKVLNTDLTAIFQREILLENNSDPDLTDGEKTISIKVFTEPENSDMPFIHVYFNRKAPQTLRRLIYKTLHYYLGLPCVIESIPEGPDRDLFTKIILLFFNKKENAYKLIFESIGTYIEKRIKDKNEHLIKNFATAKQKALNETRLYTLRSAFEGAERNLNDNLNKFAQLKNKYLQCKKDLDNYAEVEFSAIEVLLTKIKTNPKTKEFYKNGNHNLIFCIEEPLIHTESETWAKYLANSNSEINGMIYSYAKSFASTYNTTYDILRYAVQRLIKELFVDQKIRIYTAAVLGMNDNETYFDIKKYTLTTADYMPHPHIGTETLTCWNEAKNAITNCVLDNDGETAFLQLTYALQQMTASDSVVTKKLIKNILSNSYAGTLCYQRKSKEERETFETIIKEFIKDETNKINNIVASES